MNRLLSILFGCVTPIMLVIAVAGILVVPASAEPIYLNEATVQGTERVELYNPNGTDVDLDGWEIAGSNGTFTIPSGTTILADDYLTITLTGDIISDLGGEISIADMVGGEVIDRVIYGQLGAAPLPHPGGTVSLCRAPDGSSGPPLFDEAGYSDAGNWTLDLTSTFDSVNDAPVPALGSTVVVNEFNSGPPNSVEFYNPSVLATPVDLTGWFITDGQSEAFLAGIVPSGGVLLLNLPTQIEFAQLVYLFDDQGVRVDQLGFLGSVPFDHTQCLLRCPDGTGPNDGFDWLTSGGEVFLYIGQCTLGEFERDWPRVRGSGDDEADLGTDEDLVSIGLSVEGAESAGAAFRGGPPLRLSPSILPDRPELPPVIRGGRERDICRRIFRFAPGSATITHRGGLPCPGPRSPSCSAPGFYCSP